jgi:imidazolonepropionase-like amidohydrolase
MGISDMKFPTIKYVPSRKVDRWSQAGLSPLEALRTATVNPAKFFSMLDSMGTIEQGKVADLVLLEANPLEDIRNTQKIAAGE